MIGVRAAVVVWCLTQEALREEPCLLTCLPAHLPTSPPTDLAFPFPPNCRHPVRAGGAAVGARERAGAG